MIGIAGGSGSGKTTLARELQRLLGGERCQILSQDDYYRDLSGQFDGDGQSVNFDHPSSIDFDLLAWHLEEIQHGKPVEVPVYDFVTHSRLSRTQVFKPVEIVVLEGTLILNDARIRRMLRCAVFVDCPEEVRYARRLHRDTHERGRTAQGVERQFQLQVKPMHDEFVQPTLSVADLVVAGLGSQRDYAIEIIQFVQPRLRSQGES